MLKLLKRMITPPMKPHSRVIITERDLIRRESAIGSKLFGLSDPDTHREFFCLDAKTWVWHEEWTDPATSKRIRVNTRYEIRSDRIVKIQNGLEPESLSIEELRNFSEAVRTYYLQISEKVYNRPVRL